MSEELFAVERSGKPALLLARERLQVAEHGMLMAVRERDDLGQEGEDFLLAADAELQEARAEVRRLELAALQEARG